MNDLRISVVLDRRVEPQLADLRTAAATIDDVRRIALRLRALRPAWRAIGLTTNHGVEPPRLSPQGQMVRVDVHVRSNEPLVEQSATSAEDARDKLEALSCTFAGVVSEVSIDVHPTALDSDLSLFRIQPAFDYWICEHGHISLRELSACPTCGVACFALAA